MALYKTSGEDGLKPIPEKDFGIDNYEKRLEDLLEKTPQIPGGEDVLFIGRQVSTKHGPLDLLGINADGDAVIIELKRGVAPRDIVAQALSYTSWINNLDYEQLNKITEEYHIKKGKEFTDLVTAFNERFNLEEENENEEGNESEAPSEFNKKQKIYIIAQDINDEVISVAKFLRKSGVDIVCIKFTYHSVKGDHEIFNIEWVVGGIGGEMVGETKKTIPRGPGKHDEFFNLFIEELRINLGKGLQPSYFGPKEKRNYRHIRYPGFGTLHYELRFVVRDVPEPSMEIALHKESPRYDGFLHNFFAENSKIFQEKLKGEWMVGKWGKSWERIYKLIPLKDSEMDIDLAKKVAIEMRDFIKETQNLLKKETQKNTPK